MIHLTLDYHRPSSFLCATIALAMNEYVKRVGNCSSRPVSLCSPSGLVQWLLYTKVQITCSTSCASVVESKKYRAGKGKKSQQGYWHKWQWDRKRRGATGIHIVCWCYCPTSSAIVSSWTNKRGIGGSNSITNGYRSEKGIGGCYNMSHKTLASTLFTHIALMLPLPVLVYACIPYHW